MTYLVQVWAMPGLQMPGPIELPTDPPTTLKTVEVDFPNGVKSPALLVQTAGTQASMEAAPDADMRRIGRILSRLSFGLLEAFTVISARLVPSGLAEGDDVSEIAFPGPPPGIAMFEGKVGYAKTGGIDQAFLSGDIATTVESAITWFLAGLTAANAVQQVMLHWSGLETLAPVRRGPWRCLACDRDVERCPHCEAATEAPLSVRTIREFLRAELGVDQREFRSLYDLRCNIAHGGLSLDPDGLSAASGKAFRVQELLLMAIKKALDWPVDRPPMVQPRGFTIVGVPGLGLSSKVPGPNFYDQPGIYPA